jgi:hypothetical protein
LQDAVQLQALLSAPLHGPEGEAWLKEPRKMPEEFEKWVDAQYFSAEATSIDKAGGWKDLTYPLAATRKKETLDSIWKTINLVSNPCTVKFLLLNHLLGIHQGFWYRH